MDPKTARTTLLTTHTTISFEDSDSGRSKETRAPTIERAALLQRFGMGANQIDEAIDHLAAEAETYPDAFQEFIAAMKLAASSPTLLISILPRLKTPKPGDFASFVKWLVGWHKSRVGAAGEQLRAFVQLMEAEQINATVNAITGHEMERPYGLPNTVGDPQVSGGLAPAIKGRLESINARLPFHVRLVRALKFARETSRDELTVAEENLEFLKLKKPINFSARFAEWERFYGAVHEQLDALSTLQPLGYLHLERINYTPVGVEHGELVASIPLSPGEQVHMLHKEWTTTSEEFHRLVSDQLDEFSSRGVVEKTDLAKSSQSQRQHSSNLSVSVSVSGGFGPFFQASTRTGYSAAKQASQSRQQSIHRSKQITEKASSRSKREHRVSFKLAKKTHVEDETIRTIKNPDPIHPVRYDFYQLMRKWQVDVRRYGVRLTYQAFVPEPAGALLGPYQELDQIDQLIERGYRLDFKREGLTRENYLEKAAPYNATVDPPPSITRSIQAALWENSGAKDKEESPYSTQRSARYIVPVPDGYVFADKFFIPITLAEKTGHPGLPLNTDPVDYHPHLFLPLPPPANPHTVVDYTESESSTPTKALLFMANAPKSKSFMASLTVWFTVTDEHYEKWQAETFNAIQQAAQTQFESNRQHWEARRSRIIAELEAQDALSLRKLEREQLMHTLIKYLLPNTETYLANRNQASEHGRLVTFLHQAIEWENINYVLYPHYWAHENISNLQRSLQHRDPFHEAFLRAGAARVFLTIRPDWEQDFLGFIKNANAEALPETDVYTEIARELQWMAQNQYPGIKMPEEGEEIDAELATKQAEGELIMSWHEYTPTSSLDIKIGESVPTEGESADQTYDPPKGWVSLTSAFASLKQLFDHLKDRVLDQE